MLLCDVVVLVMIKVSLRLPAFQSRKTNPPPSTLDEMWVKNQPLTDNFYTAFQCRGKQDFVNVARIKPAGRCFMADLGPSVVRRPVIQSVLWQSEMSGRDRQDRQWWFRRWEKRYDWWKLWKNVHLDKLERKDQVERWFPEGLYHFPVS